MAPGKSEMRRTLHERLRTSAAEERLHWSASVREHLQTAARWQTAHTVMLFAALRYEPDLVPLVEAHLGKRLLFPSLESNLIVAREVRSPGDLMVAGNGIREPDPNRCRAVPPEEIELILVPGLGFGRDGTRLGRGKGHYDRFLPGLSSTAFLCGVCFRCQVSDALPVESHDVPMDALLTESGWEDTSPCPRPSVP